MGAIQTRMDDAQRSKKVREIRRLLLDVEFAARRQVGELEQLRRLLAKLRDFSKQVEPVECGGEAEASGGEALSRGRTIPSE